MSRQIPTENIQVDTSDEDSLFDTDAESIICTAGSRASSVRDYCYENGRRYHAYRYGQYPMPNDEEEQDRLQYLHHLFKMHLGGELFSAPVMQLPQRVLDLGTGTGVWAIELADEFPTAEVVGTDLSPIQPNYSPPNCRFFVDDVESEWAFTRAEAFDYIHGRALGGAIGDWPRLLEQAYSNLKPGGWIEFQEYDAGFYSDDGTHEQAPLVQDWVTKLRDASGRFGKQMHMAPELERLIQGAGFVNVTDNVYKSPLGTWPKDPQLKRIGKVCEKAVIDAIEPYTLALFTRVLGYSFEGARDYMTAVRGEFENSKCHLYGCFHFVYGQKPMDG